MENSGNIPEIRVRKCSETPSLGEAKEISVAPLASFDHFSSISSMEEESDSECFGKQDEDAATLVGDVKPMDDAESELEYYDEAWETNTQSAPTIVISTPEPPKRPPGPTNRPASIDSEDDYFSEYTGGGGHAAEITTQAEVTSQPTSQYFDVFGDPDEDQVVPMTTTANPAPAKNNYDALNNSQAQYNELNSVNNDQQLNGIEQYDNVPDYEQQHAIGETYDPEQTLEQQEQYDQQQIEYDQQQYDSQNYEQQQSDQQQYDQQNYDQQGYDQQQYDAQTYDQQQYDQQQYDQQQYDQQYDQQQYDQQQYDQQQYDQQNYDQQQYDQQQYDQQQQQYDQQQYDQQQQEYDQQQYDQQQYDQQQYDQQQYDQQQYDQQNYDPEQYDQSQNDQQAYNDQQSFSQENYEQGYDQQQQFVPEQYNQQTYDTQQYSEEMESYDNVEASTAVKYPTLSWDDAPYTAVPAAVTTATQQQRIKSTSSEDEPVAKKPERPAPPKPPPPGPRAPKKPPPPAIPGGPPGRPAPPHVPGSKPAPPRPTPPSVPQSDNMEEEEDKQDGYEAEDDTELTSSYASKKKSKFPLSPKKLGRLVTGKDKKDTSQLTGVKETSKSEWKLKKKEKKMEAQQKRKAEVENKLGRLVAKDKSVNKETDEWKKFEMMLGKSKETLSKTQAMVHRMSSDDIENAFKAGRGTTNIGSNPWDSADEHGSPTADDFFKNVDPRETWQGFDDAFAETENIAKGKDMTSVDLDFVPLQTQTNPPNTSRRTSREGSPTSDIEDLLGIEINVDTTMQGTSTFASQVACITHDLLGLSSLADDPQELSRNPSDLAVSPGDSGRNTPVSNLRLLEQEPPPEAAPDAAPSGGAGLSLLDDVLGKMGMDEIVATKAPEIIDPMKLPRRDSVTTNPENDDGLDFLGLNSTDVPVTTPTGDLLSGWDDTSSTNPVLPTEPVVKSLPEVAPPAATAGIKPEVVLDRSDSLEHATDAEIFDAMELKPGTKAPTAPKRPEPPPSPQPAPPRPAPPSQPAMKIVLPKGSMMSGSGTRPSKTIARDRPKAAAGDGSDLLIAAAALGKPGVQSPTDDFDPRAATGVERGQSSSNEAQLAAAEDPWSAAGSKKDAASTEEANSTFNAFASVEIKTPTNEDVGYIAENKPETSATVSIGSPETQKPKSFDPFATILGDEMESTQQQQPQQQQTGSSDAGFDPFATIHGDDAFAQAVEGASSPAKEETSFSRRGPVKAALSADFDAAFEDAFGGADADSAMPVRDAIADPFGAAAATTSEDFQANFGSEIAAKDSGIEVSKSEDSGDGVEAKAGNLFNTQETVKQKPPSRSATVTSESTDEEEYLTQEPLPPFLEKFKGDGWFMLVRMPLKKKLTAQRFWKTCYIRLMYNNNGPVIKVYHNDQDKDSFYDLQIQPAYQMCDLGLQQYDQYGKCHTIKLQLVFYRESVGVKSERLAPAFGDLIRVRNLKGIKDLVHRPKKTMILEHAPQYSELIKFGGLDYQTMKTFMNEIEDMFFALKVKREGTPPSYTKDEVTVDINDEYYVEVNKDGGIVYHKARVRIHCVSFLSGQPTIELGINDKKRRGKEVVGRHDIIPIKTEEWVHTEDPEYHAIVDKEAFEKLKVIRMKPLDACPYEVMRFRVRPRQNKELPLQIRIQQSLVGLRFEIRADVTIPGYSTTSRRANQTPCENISIRFDLPEPWIYYFRVEKRGRYGAVHSNMRKPGKIKGLERVTQLAQGMLNPSLIEVSRGLAKYEHVHHGIVWRIDRLPGPTDGAYKTHLFHLKLDLGQHDPIPESFSNFCYVNYFMKNSTVSRAQVRSISIENTTADEPADRWVHHTALYDYKVEMDMTTSLPKSPLQLDQPELQAAESDNEAEGERVLSKVEQAQRDAEAAAAADDSTDSESDSD